jgi:hypothetical protein
MEQNFSTFSVDEFSEIVVNGSEPIEPRRSVQPPMSEDKKEFLQAIDQAQRHYTGRSLSWAEIFDVLVSLGYRKVEPSVAPSLPPQTNGDAHRDTRADDAASEKPL